MCAPAKAARSSWRATRSTRSIRGKLCSRGGGRTPGTLQSRAAQGSDGAGRERPAPGDHLGRCDRATGGQARTRRQQGGGHLGGGAGHVLRPARRLGPGPGRPAGAVRDLRLRAASRGKPPGIRPRPGGGVRLWPREIHRVVRCGLPRHWPGLHRERARFARSHGFAHRDVAKLVYLGPRMDPHRPQCRPVAFDPARLRGGAERWRWRICSG